MLFSAGIGTISYPISGVLAQFRDGTIVGVAGVCVCVCVGSDRAGFAVHYPPFPSSCDGRLFESLLLFTFEALRQDVNHLHPSDFKMLFSAGDSITAGFAMHGLPTEYRYLSLMIWKSLKSFCRKDVYAIGADKDANTLFTYLQLYNPQLVGGSTGT